MNVTLFIQVQACLRFKSGTDPSVRPSLVTVDGRKLITAHTVVFTKPDTTVIEPILNYRSE